MRHIDPRYGVARKDAQQRARFEPEQPLSRPQHGQGALLADHIEQNLAHFFFAPHVHSLSGIPCLRNSPFRKRIMPTAIHPVTPP